jgi:signal transduction histidine kinase
VLETPAQSLLEALAEPCLVVRRDGCIVAANRSAVRLLQEQPVAGRALGDCFNAGSEAIDSLLRRCLGSGEPTVGAVEMTQGPPRALRVEGTRLVGEPGAPALALLRLFPRHAPGSGFVALNHRLGELTREVTRRRRAEEALAAKVAEMQEQDRQKNRFIALLSHELRNPLAPILTLVHVLKADATPERVQRSIGIMERHVQHLIRLVDDLLDFSRIATGKVRIVLDDVCLGDVLNMAAASIRPKADARGQLLEVAVPEGVVVRADADRLRQVIGNLLDNASKFTPPGGRIGATASTRDGYALVRVEDTGPGVAPTLRSKLFDFFMQGDTSTDRMHNGLGLGLALARNLIELQGGSITLAPGNGGGAEFVVSVPLAEARAAGGRVEGNPNRLALG